MANETTLLFDTEKSAESYVHLYASEPGVPTDKPLWPAPVPVVGVSGKVGQGKTTFLLDIAAGPIRRLDVPAEMLKLHPNGYRPLDTFAWFWGVVKSVPPGRFRVIAVDVAEEIEQGVAEWVWENPLYFNTTRQQFIKMSGVYQGLVSSFWKSILMDITSRCETFAFANHVGLVFGADGRPVPGKEKSKGRPVMKQSASLYINLTRDKDAAGHLKDIPAGVVDLSEGGKSRLMTWAVRGGVRQKVPVLPPRMPVATPQAIRDFFVTPPDTSRLTPEQLAPERTLTEDERTQLRIAAADAEANVERLRMERIAEERKAAAGQTEINVEFEPEPNAEPAPASPTASVPPPVPAPVPPGGTLPPSPATAKPTGADASGETSNGKASPGPQEAAEPVKVPRGLKGHILGFLSTRAVAVNANDLFAEMNTKHGKNSAQVHAACKQLRDDKKIKIVVSGETVLIGMPEASFELPAASQPQPQPSPTPATATPPAPAPVNGHANGNIPAASVAPWNRSAFPVLAPDLLTSVRTLWLEFCHMKAWPIDQREQIWGEAILKRFNAMTDRDLTEADLTQTEENLARKIDAFYTERGTPNASPFRGELAAHAATARV